jgi:hypothetical protein
MTQSMIAWVLVPSSKVTLYDPHGSSENEMDTTRFDGSLAWLAATMSPALII